MEEFGTLSQVKKRQAEREYLLIRQFEDEDSFEEWSKSVNLEKHFIAYYKFLYSQRKGYKCSALIRVRRPCDSNSIIVESFSFDSAHVKHNDEEQGLSSPIKETIKD
uniref:Uncharacterized protein n=1 Tax=Ditylenchus dipsaci TaxID=166011 RepID=A0A915E143_9BILA